MKTEKNSSKLSIRKLAKETGADRASIARWTDGIEDEAEALAAIQEHQSAKNASSAAADLESLSWWQRLVKARAEKLERENRRAEKLESRELMLASDHHFILSAVISRIETVPSRSKAQFGLTAAQATGIQQLLDEAREAAVKDIEDMPEDA